jgi:hypothetical protein
MNRILKLEELVLFIISLYLFWQTNLSLWCMAGFLLSDIGMIGYLVNNKSGAWMYNLFHHRGIAAIILLTGWQGEIEWLYIAGLFMFGHIAMDRLFGYGLKYPDSFHHTHLGWIGKNKE